MSTPADQLAALLASLFNIAFRPQGKVMSAALVERLRVLVNDAAAAGDPIYDLLDDLLSAPPPPRVTQSFERPAYDDPRFEAWRRQRYEDAQ